MYDDSVRLVVVVFFFCLPLFLFCYCVGLVQASVGNVNV